MRKILNGVGGVVLLAATGTAAMAADTPTAIITATGHALPVCTVGQWVKTSGSGTLTGGSNALLTYNESDLVDANSMSVLNESKAVEVHIPVLCNTGMTWGLDYAKGALRNDTTPTPAAGFSSQWLYHVWFGPRNAGGGLVGTTTVDVPTTDGTPDTGGSNLNATKALQLSYFALIFEPHAATQRMMAGAYSETFTFTVSPGL